MESVEAKRTTCTYKTLVIKNCIFMRYAHVEAIANVLLYF